jgi:hypothetical protein
MFSETQSTMGNQEVTIEVIDADTTAQAVQAFEEVVSAALRVDPTGISGKHRV